MGKLILCYIGLIAQYKNKIKGCNNGWKLARPFKDCSKPKCCCCFFSKRTLNIL